MVGCLVFGGVWLVFGYTRRSTLRVENLSRTILRENSTNSSHSIYQESRLGESCDKNQTQPTNPTRHATYEVSTRKMCRSNKRR
jgi:hypothetical protein